MILQTIQIGLRVSPNEPALGRRIFDPFTKAYGGYVWQTYTEVNDRITRFGSGLVKIHQDAFGLSHVAQKFSVGIWAINRPEWTITSEGSEMQEQKDHGRRREGNVILSAMVLFSLAMD